LPAEVQRARPGQGGRPENPGAGRSVAGGAVVVVVLLVSS
jgi:hypothetical protein